MIGDFLCKAGGEFSLSFGNTARNARQTGHPHDADLFYQAPAAEHTGEETTLNRTNRRRVR